MSLLISCPKCQAPMELDGPIGGGCVECPKCTQWFLVGESAAALPVVIPRVSAADPDRESSLSKGDHPRQTVRGEAMMLERDVHPELRGRFVSGSVPVGARAQKRKCSQCGAPMSISHAVDHALNFLLPLGTTLHWECPRCGHEIKVQSPWRLFLMIAATPLVLLWWLVFAESSRHHAPDDTWWKQLAEQLTPHDSKGSFWFILFLVFFAMAPLALVRELVVRLRNPRLS